MADDRQQNNDKKTWLERMADVFSGEPKDKHDLSEVILDAAELNIINDITHEMISGALQLSDLQVRDIMVPRSQVDFIKRNTPFKDALAQIVECAHSRVPVMDEDNDKVIGVLLTKDLLSLAVSSEFNVEKMSGIWLELLREPMVVPESKRLNKLLKEFRAQRNHMAIVIDEYGAVAGIVTIEDILEEIVGEIEDEFDYEEVEDIVKNEDGTFLVQALTELDEFNEYFGTSYSDDEFDTLGGYITHQFGHLPARGEYIVVGDIEFYISKCEGRRIKAIKVRLLPIKD